MRLADLVTRIGDRRDA